MITFHLYLLVLSGLPNLSHAYQNIGRPGPTREYYPVITRRQFSAATAASSTLPQNGTSTAAIYGTYHGVFAFDVGAITSSTCTPCSTGTISSSASLTTGAYCTPDSYSGVFRPDPNITTSRSTQYCYGSSYTGPFQPSTSSTLPCCDTDVCSVTSSSSSSYTGVFRTTTTTTPITTSSSSSTITSTSSASPGLPLTSSSVSSTSTSGSTTGSSSTSASSSTGTGSTSGTETTTTTGSVSGSSSSASFSISPTLRPGTASTTTATVTLIPVSPTTTPTYPHSLTIPGTLIPITTITNPTAQTPPPTLTTSNPFLSTVLTISSNHTLSIISVLGTCPTSFPQYGTGLGMGRFANATAPYSNSTVANSTLSQWFCNVCVNDKAICCPPGVECGGDGHCPWLAMQRSGFMCAGKKVAI